MKSMIIPAIGLLALVGTSASAASLNISGDINTSNGGTGSAFTGGMEYVFNSGNTGTLTISLTNTTNLSIGGYLTGFVFNIDSSDNAASASLSSATNANFLDTGSENAAPFGSFDAGAALGANWSGGGSPSAGIAVGATESFQFTITASDAGSLNSMSFVGLDGTDFAVRFRGLDNGGSDKLLATIPTPGTGALALLSLGVATRRRR